MIAIPTASQVAPIAPPGQLPPAPRRPRRSSSPDGHAPSRRSCARRWASASPSRASPITAPTRSYSPGWFCLTARMSSALRSRILPAISRWQPIASSVTKAPAISSTSSKSGIAVISLVFSPTTTSPSDSLFSVAHAEPMWIAARPASWSAEPQRVLAVDRDKMRRSVFSCTSLIQPKRHFSNAAGSRRARTRPKVSSEGMPLPQVEVAGQTSRSGRWRTRGCRRSSWPQKGTPQKVIEDDVDQRMLASPFDLRVLEFLEVLLE